MTVPWDRQRYFANGKTGTWGRVQDTWNVKRDPEDPNKILSVDVGKKGREPRFGNPELTPKQMEQVFHIMGDTDCTFIEAAIAVVTTRNVTQDWMTKALQAPKCRWKSTASYMEAQEVAAERAPQVAWRDPREKKKA